MRILVVILLASVCATVESGVAAGRMSVMHVKGVVAGSDFTPPNGATPSSTIASHYGTAKVCADTNDNGVCDPSEESTMTDLRGRFELLSHDRGDLVVEIAAGSMNAGHVAGRRNVFRASLGQVLDGQRSSAPHATSAVSDVVITPLSTEVARMMDDDHIDFFTAKWRLAQRLEVPIEQVLSDPSDLAFGPFQKPVLTEAVILTNRFALAAKMVDRHDVSPAALTVNPSATSPLIQIKEAQQTSMTLEGIPRYDHIFIIVLENKATSSIKNSPFAPKINAYLTNGNQFTSYFATGNPSEPNRMALGAGDDFGVTDDSAWNCMPAADVADLPEDPIPAGLNSPCTNATNHNIKNKPDMFTSMANGGMTWRIYSESLNPGRDIRLNGASDATLLAPDHIYPATSPVGAIGNPNLMVRFASGLYATKHNAAVSFQAARSSAEFFSSNRTMGGGQWDEAIMNSPATPGGYNVDQLGTDLWSGDIGYLNFLEPDQCDDMHGLTVQGTETGTGLTKSASDCSSGATGIYRGDNYTDYLIKKIQASPVWTNPYKRVAIVIMFDEGSATTGFNSCCGWNPSAGSSIAGKSLGVLFQNPDETVAVDSTIARYNQGNKGHGTSIFGLLTNQEHAPKGLVDSDAYTHISFVRTLQDMFGLADPGDDWSYMNRTKYTPKFIADHLALLPEYGLSADPHFDAVRPMNHAYVIPGGYVQKSGFVTPPGAQVGPDATQTNLWAIK